MKCLLLIFSSLLFAFPISGQGHLLLVGGGSEKINGWSDDPYSWAIEKSGNKRVAIITYDPDVSSWLPNYFMNLGAVDARNFILEDEATANLQETYDSLITYDVIFFKGGNQWRYYDYYKNTITHQAVQEVFASGGVIGGTSAGLAILSKVTFTAENGSVYSDEALEDPFNQYMTLENDFLDLFPGYVFDSHFVERARFGRLLGFMGNWEISQEEKIVGIGVDDKTALCIDSDGMAYAFGTGAVTVYIAGEDNDFRVSGEKLLADAITAKQLLHECTIDLNTFEVTGLETTVVPEFDAVSYQNKLWLSGSDKIYNNTKMLTHFTGVAPENDTVVIVTGNNTSSAGFFSDYLEEDLQTPTLILQAIPVNLQDPAWAERIERLTKFLFINNDYFTFMNFLFSWPNGTQLKDRVLDGEKLVAFVGDNSRYAGKTVLVNYEQEYASYDGLLEFEAGWGLLRNSIIMPKTYSSDIDNENASAGIPYGMVHENLKLGFWLYDDCYLYYQPDDNQATITSYGEFPMILMENPGTTGDFSTQSAVSSGEPRDVAGFGEMHLQLMDSTVTKTVDLVKSVFEQGYVGFQIHPNPARDYFTVDGVPGQETIIRLYNVKGENTFTQRSFLPTTLSVQDLERGIYILEVKIAGTSNLHRTKLIIQ